MYIWAIYIHINYIYIIINSNIYKEGNNDSYDLDSWVKDSVNKRDTHIAIGQCMPKESQQQEYKNNLLH